MGSDVWISSQIYFFSIYFENIILSGIVGGKTLYDEKICLLRKHSSNKT
jgi:hypothetical protein